MVITLRGGLAHSQVVVRDPRLKEKVVVAINAARAARRQAEEVRLIDYYYLGFSDKFCEISLASFLLNLSSALNQV